VWTSWSSTEPSAARQARGKTFHRRQLGVPAAAFRDYGRRAQTRLDHAGEISAHLGLRAFTRADVPLALTSRRWVGRTSA